MIGVNGRRAIQQHEALVCVAKVTASTSASPPWRDREFADP